MKKIFLIIFCVLLICLTFSVVMVTSTETGLQWVVALAQKAVPGRLSISSVKGRLIGPLKLNGVDYSAEDLAIAVDAAGIDWKLSRLLALQLHIVDLNASGIRIETGESEQPESQEIDGLPEISLPVSIRIDNLLISNVSIAQQRSASPFVINTIALKAQMDKEGLRIDSFKVMVPDADLALKGDIEPKGSYPLSVRTDWNIHTEGYAAIQGTGSLSGDMDRLTIEQSVSAPFSTLLRATVDKPIKEPQWDMDLTLNNASINRINSTWPEMTVTAEVFSTGSVSTFDIRGTMDLKEKQYGQIAVIFSAGKEHDTWLARNVKLSIPGTAAAAALSGQYVQDDNTASFASHLTWNALSWPLHGKDPEITSSKGTLDIKGSPDDYDITLTANAAGKQVPQSSIHLKGTGTKSSLDVHSLTAKLMDGEMNASGSLIWDPSLSWKASLDAKSINPGTQWPDWKGDLAMNVTADGDMQGSSLRVNLNNASVRGDLRGYPFRTDTIFSMDGSAYHLTKLDLVSGSAILHAAGTYADAWDAQWDIAVPDLGELVQEGKGQINGKGTISGKAGLPNVIADVNASGISYASYKAGVLAIDMNVDAADKDLSRIDIKVEDVLIDTQEIKSFILKADGKIIDHSLSLSARTARESMEMSLDAGYKDTVWQGRLSGSKLDLSDFGVWGLKEPALFSLSSQSAQTGNLCWIQSPASVCFQAAWTDTEGLNAQSALSEIPLSLFKPVTGPSVVLEGSLGGDIDISYGNNTLYGKASIVLPSGSVSYALDAEDSVTLPLGLTRLDTTLDKDGVDMDVALSLLERGKISSSVRLPGFSPLDMHMEKQKVSGSAGAELKALDLLPLFISGVDKPEGVFSSDLSISGTLADPAITGQVNLVKGKAGIPDLGLLMKDIDLKITSGSSGIVDIDGKLSSGDGKAHVQGKLEIKDPAHIKADIRVKGEKFEAIKTPEVWVVVSPDVSIKLEKKDIHVEGDIIIPEALIEPPDLSGAVSASQDVVIISEESPETENDKWNIHSRMQLTLGDNVRFKGFGLSGRIAGGLKITEEPGRATKAQGEMQVLDGQYKAYGQELTIDKGRLLFVGLIDDPGLDIRAVRKIQDVSAGVQVTGTLKTPAMSIYSVPAMDQSDALAYLMFGRPMNRLSGSEGGQMHNAASSAYVSGGGLLAKKIGAAFGIRDIEIEKGETEQESALVIGKYLSPKLYVSYGIGIFEPINTFRTRYSLSPRWQVQTEYGLESGGDVLYSIER
jgi:translocation and assembly module TamB